MATTKEDKMLFAAIDELVSKSCPAIKSCMDKSRAKCYHCWARYLGTRVVEIEQIEEEEQTDVLDIGVIVQVIKDTWKKTE